MSVLSEVIGYSDIATGVNPAVVSCRISSPFPLLRSTAAYSHCSPESALLSRTTSEPRCPVAERFKRATRHPTSGRMDYRPCTYVSADEGDALMVFICWSAVANASSVP